MLKLTFALRRHPTLTREEFQIYWLKHHGPLVASYAEALGVVAYQQTHTVDLPISEPIALARGSIPSFYDGVAELWWNDADTLSARGAKPEARAASRALLEDEARFIDLANSPLWMGVEHRIVGAA